jgi:hypothetical protein
MAINLQKQFDNIAFPITASNVKRKFTKCIVDLKRVIICIYQALDDIKTAMLASDMEWSLPETVSNQYTIGNAFISSSTVPTGRSALSIAP